MTDNEIIKAFEYCEVLYSEDCIGCPCFNSVDGCIGANDVLSLINRQKAEIEGMTYKVEHLEFRLENARGEAIKEFAERLKKDLCYEDFFETNVVFLDESKIDNLVKEMVGEDK